ncbi:MAG: hypothetical protein WBH86_00485 [Thermogutta sp.]|mgnify:CR=1 FL=1|jgi:hypothetical protein|nr:hypothetical protein [Thermogutta sp.]HOP77108.1 hypothetical protein [Thermogutta sp.]HPU06650.1 hypothetical protein [Thermogutta sp.]
MKTSVATLLTCLVAVCGMILIAWDASWVVGACSDTIVRPNSPSETTVQACPPAPISRNCPGSGTVVFTGFFQCDQPNAGTACQGAGVPSFTYCKKVCNCLETVNPATGQLICDPSPVCEWFAAEQKREVACH